MSQERILSELKHRMSEVTSGKLTLEELINDIRMRAYGTPPISADELRSHIQQYDPSFTRVLTSEEQQARARLSHRAQDSILTYMSARASLDVKTTYDYLPRRHEMHLFDYSGTPEADAYNKQVAHVLKNGTAEEKGTFLYNHVMTRSKPVADALMNASVEDIIENYGRYYEHIALMAEIVTIANSDVFRFTPEQYQELKKLETMQISLSEILTRIDLISLPMYQQLPLEDFTTRNYEGSYALEAELNALAKQHGEPSTETEHVIGPLGTTAQVIRGHATFVSDVPRSRLEYAIASKGGEPRMIYDSMGTRIHPEKISEYLLKNRPVFANLPGQGIVAVKLQPGSLPPQVIPAPEEGPPVLIDQLASLTRDLLTQVSDASPWWMITGSREFSSMEKAMKDFHRLAGSNSPPLSPEQEQALQGAVTAMEQAAAAYLAYKAQQPNVKFDPATNQYQGKNARETARLQAAHQLLQHADRLNFTVDCLTRPQVAADYARQRLQQEDEQERRRAEEKARQDEKRSQEIVKKQSILPKEQQCTTSREELLQKAETFKATLSPDFERDPLPELQRECTFSAELLAKIALRNQKVGGLEADVYNHMSKLTTLHLIKLERHQWKTDHPNEPVRPGVVEQTLLAGGKSPRFHESKKDPKTGEETSLFRKLVGPLHPARLERFLLQDEFKTLGTQYLDALDKQNNPPSVQKSDLQKDSLTQENPKKETGGAGFQKV